MRVAEYIWVDGVSPVASLRSKTKVIDGAVPPDWSFDGSSTCQGEGHDADVLLKPVLVVPDPIRGDGAELVLCEAYDYDDNPLPSNHRAKLAKILQAGVRDKYAPWVGFEQEYVIYDGRTGQPLGWPADPTHVPLPQGQYYCSIDGDSRFGGNIVDTHLFLCMAAGLMIYGTNAEVMAGQHEFQIGIRNNQDNGDVLAMSDHLWLARYLLRRVAAQCSCYISLDCKPKKGDWNGSGLHTNFSTKQMRNKEVGKDQITKAIKKLEAKHLEHVEVYGHGVKERLSGEHETCHWNEFRTGDADRGASIRIPKAVAKKGYGYIEDRRPGSNADPYIVAAKMLETVCDE